VRSRLEYASLVWSPIYDVHSSLLERVQRRFLKNVVFMLTGACPPRGCPQGLLLGEVGLQSLLNRRMEHSVIFLFKLFRGLQECPHVLERISLRVSRSGSRVRSVFYIGQRHTDPSLECCEITRVSRPTSILFVAAFRKSKNSSPSPRESGRSYSDECSVVVAWVLGFSLCNGCCVVIVFCVSFSFWQGF
jgi:hypothetical protein